MSTKTQPWDGFVTDGVPALSAEELRFFAGKRVLITGAGGFIGSALARAFAGVSLDRLLLLDTAEYGLYRLEQHFEQVVPSFPVWPILGSVCDDRLLEEVFGRHTPQIVFHAAALKHVPLLETNAVAAAETNVLGTGAVVQAAERWGVERFLLLSTDKAVEPISVMGRTKWLAEQVAVAASKRAKGETAFRVIRLCNVLGSTGSVAPLFARQIAEGGPVTVTHPEATRYFISVCDAVRYLLRAVAGSEEGTILIPKAGPARTIRELAEYLISRAPAGAEGTRVAYTALRRADKLHEVFVGPGETATREVGRVFLEVEGFAQEGLDVGKVMDEVRAAVRDRDPARLLPGTQRAMGTAVLERADGGEGSDSMEEVGR